MDHSAWLDFLTQQGVSLDTQNCDSAAVGSIQLVPLLDLLPIRIEGPEAEKYLQGQLTADLNQLGPDRSLLTANCSPKGMVISAIRLFMRQPGQLLARLPRAIAEPALTNLKKFSVFSKVDIEATDDDWVGLGLIGCGATKLLSQLGIEAPAQPNQQTGYRDAIIVRAVGEAERFEIWCPTAQAQALWQSLSAQATCTAPACWIQSEINAGLVQLDSASIDSYIPQMLNLQAVDSISFDKGCYTGQEVVARLQFRGKLKKLMYAGRCETGAKIGDTLYSTTGRSAGKVLAVIGCGDRSLLQMVIGKTAADDNQLRLNSSDGPIIELLPLPYTIDPELFERPERPDL